MNKKIIFLLVAILVFPLLIVNVSGLNQDNNIPLSAQSGTSFVLSTPLDISSTSVGRDYGAAIALDSINDIHVVWYDVSNYIVYYANSKNSFSLNVIASGALEYSNPKIFIDSNDVVHILYLIVIGVHRSIWYVNNSGGLFVNHVNISQINGLVALYSNYDAVMDDADIIHIITNDQLFDGSHAEVYYCSLKNGNPSSKIAISSEDGEGDNVPRIAIQNNLLFVTWAWYTGIGGGEIMLSYKLDGLPWSEPYNLTQSPGFSLLEQFPDVTLDSNGNFHIFCINSTSPAHLNYYTNVNGTIKAQEFGFTWQSSPWQRISVETDSNDKIHGFWYDNLYTDEEVYYITNINGTFQYYNITNNADFIFDSYPNFVIDTNDNIHFVYTSNKSGNDDIYYQKMVYNPSTTTTTSEIPGYELIFISLALIGVLILFNLKTLLKRKKI